jgi:hypothetical protein
MFTTSSAEHDAQITRRFAVKKITHSAAMLWVQRQMVVRHPEDNAEQSNGVDSTFLPKISADSESEECALLEDVRMTRKIGTSSFVVRGALHNATIITNDP